MNQQQYKLGWQIACWSTLAIAVCGLLSIISHIFGIFQAVAIGFIGYGFLTASNELVKDGNPAAAPMKSAATTLMIISGLNIIGAVIAATAKYESFSDVTIVVAFAGLFEIACGVLVIMYKNKIGEAIRHLNIENGLFGAGILVYAIGLMVAGFGMFVLGISPSLGTLGMFGVLAVVGAITALVGEILWIIGMFQVTEKAVK
ncbi:MAG: hypothetical protein HDS54_08970 [Barnesiella sp.]|nr:hypothetical protein [Bacteroidales bacterium]MBD5248274.1 hypothetical protein [Barnesiella sp.]